MGNGMEMREHNHLRMTRETVLALTMEAIGTLMVAQTSELLFLRTWEASASANSPIHNSQQRLRMLQLSNTALSTAPWRSQTVGSQPYSQGVRDQVTTIYCGVVSRYRVCCWRY